MNRTGSHRLPSKPAEVETHLEASQTRNAVASTTTGQPQLKPLNGKERVRLFLDAIREDFIDKADILESGLQDHLVQSGVLNQQDSESLQAGHLPTRGERARHLWKLLSSIDHEVVAEKVAPILATLFAHIIPECFWVLPEQHHTSGECGSLGGDGNYKRCTRCAIQARLRPTSVADFLYKFGAIHIDHYKDVTSNQRLRPTDWPQLFSAFTHLPQPAARRHGDDMTSLLLRHSLSVPCDLVDLMTKGFPCTCPPSGKDLMLNTLGRLDSRRPSDVSSASGISICLAPSAQETKELSDLRRVLMSLEIQKNAKTDSSELPSRAATIRYRKAPTKTRRACMKAYTWYGPQPHKKPDLQPEGDSAEGDGFSAETLSPPHGPTGRRLSLVDIVLKEIEDAGSLADDEITQLGVQAEEADGNDAVSATTPGVSETRMLVSRVPVTPSTAGVGLLDSRVSMTPSTAGVGVPDSQVPVTPSMAGVGVPDSQVPVTPVMAGVGKPSGISDTASPHSRPVLGTGNVASLIRKMNADSVNVGTKTDSVCSSLVVEKHVHSIALGTEACNTDYAKTPDDAATPHTIFVSAVNTHANAVAAQKLPEDADMMTTASSDSTQKRIDSVSTPTKLKSAAQSDSLDVVGFKRRSDPVAKTSQTKPSDSDGLVSNQRHSDPVAGKPRPPLSMSRQGSRESSPLASPLKFLRADSSRDGDKYKQFVKAIDKGDFEKRRPILFGAVSNDHDDARRHGGVFSFPEVDNPVSNATDYREGAGDAAQADSIRPSQSPEGADSTDYEHVGPDDFTRHAVEHAIRNSDVDQFRKTVANDVNTTKKLTRLFGKAVIPDPSARTELQQLLANHRVIDSIYNEIFEKLEAWIDDMTADMTQSASRGDDVLDDVIQLCREVLEMCLDILLSTRMFLICAVYLNSDVKTTSSRVRDTTNRFIRDVMVLQQMTRMEAWRGVQRLGELTDEGQRGVACSSTSLEQFIPLLVSFLDSS